MKIVVIDDEPFVRKSFARLLELNGFETECFESTPDFLEAEGYVGADCLLVDYQIGPTGNGYDLVLQLRESGINTPAILLSGNFENPIEAESDSSLFACTLQKPCSADQLLAAINEAVGE